jgi:hypothetical protein
MRTRLLRTLRTSVLAAVFACLMITGLIVTFVGMGNGTDLGIALGAAALAGAVVVFATMVVVADRDR